MYDEQARRRILDEARANIERLKDNEVQHRAYRAAAAARVGVSPEELAAFNDWMASQPPEPEPEPVRPMTGAQHDEWEGWYTWADSKIANALEEERGDAIGQLLQEEHKAMADALADEIKLLRLEITALQETFDDLKKVMKADGAKVIDIPNARDAPCILSTPTIGSIAQRKCASDPI